MEQNVDNILGVSAEPENNTDNNHFEEKRLLFVSNVVLTAGIISFFILFATIAVVTVEGRYSWEKEFYFSWTGLAISVSSLIGSLAIWSFLRVISTISISLKELLKNQNDE